MPSVQIGGRTVTIERFTLAKAMRVITLLGLIQKQVPEVTREWARFRNEYAAEYAVELDRAQALVEFPDRVVYGAGDEPVLHDGQVVVAPSPLRSMSEEDWERVGHHFRVPSSPSAAELFFHMAPFVFERAEQPAMRLLGLLALDNDVINRYVASGDIWDRVDEIVDTVIRPAGLDEIMELVIVAAEVIDGQVLTKARGLGERAGNVARLLGLKTTSSREASTMSSEQPAPLNTVSVSSSRERSDGTPTESSDSPGTPSSRSETSTPPTPTPTPTPTS